MSKTTTASSVDRALEAHERANLERVTVVRTVVFTLILLWLWVNYGTTVAVRHLPVILLFIALGYIAYFTTRDRPGRIWPRAIVLTLEAFLVGFTVLAPGRTYPEEWPWPMVLRHPSFLYILILLALATMSFRPWLVIWAGFCVCLVWSLATWMIMSQPGTLSTIAAEEARSAEAMLARYLDPHYVHPDDLLVRIFCTALITAILALGAHRARRLVHEQAEVARQRTNLARYVAPKMVERLAAADRPMSIARNIEAAVLFADIKGFTRIAEGMSAEATMRLLADFHGRMAELVFAHDGTLDKFIGDGLMATFGTPEPAADDATRALACAESMLAEVQRWNVGRANRGEPPVRIAIGLHHGPVTVGDIGGGGRFEFAVIGDTVNVASRLERLTRELGHDLLISRELAAHVPTATPDQFLDLGRHPVRGRSEQVEVLALAAAHSLTHSAVAR